ncbi:MAG: ImmA/IrrE family metallo-endopeptidase [Bacteroidota bacterium]
MKVFINHNILQWAVNNYPNPLEDKFPKIKYWLQRKDSPSLKQLEKLSSVLSIPFGVFFLSEIPTISLHIPHYRTVDNRDNFLPSPEHREIIQLVKHKQSWIKEYFIQIGKEPLSFAKTAVINDDIPSTANKIRTLFGLNHDWASHFNTWTDAYKHLIDKCEEAGIFVIINGIIGNNTHRKLNVKEFRGFVLYDEYAPFIFINGQDAKAAQMFTLAHELVHIWTGSSASFDLRNLQSANNESERFCNQVAAEFLVPADKLEQHWLSEKNKENPYQILARYFKVSEIVIARRLQDLNKITQDNFFVFYNNYISKEKEKKSSGGDFYNMQVYRIGKRFTETLYTALKEGNLLYREAYQLTGLWGKTFENFIQKKIIV